MHVTLRALTIAVVALAPATADEKEQFPVDLAGDIGGPGLKLAEADKPVHRVHLTANVDKDGAGKGVLALDVTSRKVDEFGMEEAVAAIPPVKLECTLKFLKKKKILREAIPVPGPPPEPVFAAVPKVEVECRLFEIKGPKITSRLTLAIEGTDWSSARLVLADKDGKEPFALSVRGREPDRFPPCHPGCFPAGTPILVPGGAKAVDSLRVGDVVTTVGADGTAGKGKVAAVFATKNRLYEVRTDGATLTTTETQPLALAGGGLRPAGELKAGTKIHIWDGRERRTVVVRSVVNTGREAQVFNLVLGEPVLFVAGGFLARSKLPPVNEAAKP